MIPFLALLIVAAHPEFAVDLAVISRVEIHLIAKVTLFVGLEALEAELAETDNLLGKGNGDLVELGWLFVGHG